MFAVRSIISAVSLSLISTAWAVTKPADFSNMELAALQHAKLIGPLNPYKEVTFTVWLKLRNKKQLDGFVNELYNPESSNYQQFLTKEDYDTHFAPSPAAIQKIKDYFTAHGMKTKQVYTTIHVTAKVKQIEELFQIKLNNYIYKNKVVYGNSSPPKVEPTIASLILGITNLSTIPYAHPKVRQSFNKTQETKIKEPITELHLGWNSFIPQAIPTNTSLQGFTGQQIRTAYNLNGVAPINGQTINGTGQTIVIIDSCGTHDANHIRNEANVYNAANSLPLFSASNFAVVKHDGQPFVHDPSVCNDSSWNGEIALDIEASHTMAPGANIVLVLTNDVDNGQVATAINTIINNQFTIGGFSNAYVVSNSWDNDFDLQNESLDATLQTAAAMGLSLNFAAGDCGDQTYNSSWVCTSMGSTPSIQYPVSSTYVTAVGGTSLFVDSTYQYAFESGWGNYLNGSPYSGSMGSTLGGEEFP